MLIDDISSAELFGPMRNWVSWVRSSNVIGIGYPKASVSCRGYQDPLGGVWDSPVSSVDDAEAERINTIVLTLPIDLMSVVRAHYLSAGTAAEKIGKMRISKPTFYSKLRSAHRIIYVAFVTQRTLET